MRTPVRRVALAQATLALAVLAGCGTSAPTVDWNGKYTPTQKARLDALIKAKNCDGLRAELITAKATNAAKKRLDGSGTADLVAYIEFGLDEADCPKP